MEEKREDEENEEDENEKEEKEMKEKEEKEEKICFYTSQDQSLQMAGKCVNDC